MHPRKPAHFTVSFCNCSGTFAIFNLDELSYELTIRNGADGLEKFETFGFCKEQHFAEGKSALSILGTVNEYSLVKWFNG